ncbi:MAG: HD domain-containing protein [Deltaproteobacteria bacterium]|nr:HD domain-containing protein [Deltaproteobacteria bacterium]
MGEPAQNVQAQNGEGSFLPTPLESILLDIILPHSLYVKVAGKYVLFRMEGDRLTEERADALKKKNVDTVFIPADEWSKFLATLEQYDTTQLGGAEAESAISRLRSLILGYGQKIDQIAEIRREELVRFQQLASRLAQAIQKNPKVGARILRRYTDPSLYFVNHSVNVVIYGLVIGMKYGLSLRDLKTVAYSALMHNIGNMFMPKHILYKPGVLNQDEWEVIRTHPKKGASLLQELQAPSEIVTVALQHHERVDGQGYPQKLKSAEIHIFAKIIAVADVFDALTSHRPYQGPFVPALAVQMMRYMEGKFDPQIMGMTAEAFQK